MTPEQQFALSASLGNPQAPANEVRDFRIVNVALTRYELELLTKRLREYNAEDPARQFQAGRTFWLVVSAIEAQCQCSPENDYQI